MQLFPFQHRNFFSRLSSYQLAGLTNVINKTSRSISTVSNYPPRCERRIIILQRRRNSQRDKKLPKQFEAVKKEMCKIFKHNNLHITIEVDKKVMVFIDLTLDMRTETPQQYNINE